MSINLWYKNKKCIIRKLDNKTAIVTGAASGMGKAIAQLFALEGANVIVADLKQAEIDEVVNLIVKNR